MQGADSLCQTKVHAEILPEYWLLKLVEQARGLGVLAHRYEWNMNTLWQNLLAWLDKKYRPVCARPFLSERDL